MRLAHLAGALALVVLLSESRTRAAPRILGQAGDATPEAPEEVAYHERGEEERRLHVALEEKMQELNEMKASTAGEMMQDKERINQLTVQLKQAARQTKETAAALTKAHEDYAVLAGTKRQIAAKLDDFHLEKIRTESQLETTQEEADELRAELVTERQDHQDMFERLEAFEQQATKAAEGAFETAYAKFESLLGQCAEGDKPAVEELLEMVKTAQEEAGKQNAATLERERHVGFQLQKERQANVQFASNLTIMEAKNGDLGAKIKMLEEEHAKDKAKLHQEMAEAQEVAATNVAALEKEMAWYEEQLKEANAMKKALKARLLSTVDDVTTTKDSDRFAQSVLEKSSGSYSDKWAKRLVRGFMDNMIASNGRAEEIADDVRAEHLASIVAVNEQIRANVTRQETAHSKAVNEYEKQLTLAREQHEQDLQDKLHLQDKLTNKTMEHDAAMQAMTDRLNSVNTELQGPSALSTTNTSADITAIPSPFNTDTEISELSNADVQLRKSEYLLRDAIFQDEAEMDTTSLRTLSDVDTS